MNIIVFGSSERRVGMLKGKLKKTKPKKTPKPPGRKVQNTPVCRLCVSPSPFPSRCPAYSWDTFLGSGRGLGARGSAEPSSFMLPVRSWWGLGGSAGGSACGGMDRLWGSGTGRRGLLRSYTLYGGGVLFSRRTPASSALLEDEEEGSGGGMGYGGCWWWWWWLSAAGGGGGGSDSSVPDASETLQRLSDEMPLL